MTSLLGCPYSVSGISDLGIGQDRARPDRQENSASPATVTTCIECAERDHERDLFFHLRKEKSGKRNVDQDALIERLSKDPPDESVPVQTVRCIMKGSISSEEAWSDIYLPSHTSVDWDKAHSSSLPTKAHDRCQTPPYKAT